MARPREKLSNWAIGPHMTILFPQSKFANYSKNGEGIGAKVLYRWDAVPFITPRFDITYLSFGEKRTTLPGSYSLYNIMSTRNESFQLTFGTQFNQKIGRFTFYAEPMGGVFNFRTIVTIDDDYYYYLYGTPYTDTKESRTKLGWGAVVSVSGLHETRSGSKRRASHKCFMTTDYMTGGSRTTRNCSLE